MSWVEDPGIGVFGKFNITELNVDEAWMNVSSTSADPLWLYELSSNCHQCPFERRSPKATPLRSGDSQVFKIITQFTSRYQLRTDGGSRWVSASDSDKNVFCEVENAAGEFGVYELTATKKAEEGPKCSIKTKLEPVNIYYPLVLVTIFYGCLVLSCLLWRKYGPKTVAFLKTKLCGTAVPIKDYTAVSSSSNEPSASGSCHFPTSSSDNDSVPFATRRRRKKNEVKRSPNPFDKKNNQSAAGPQTPRLNERAPEPNNSSAVESLNPPQQRLQSIDTFRGICIVIMIFADDGGGLYHFFEHCTWDGLYVADLAFPWFLWIMGVCIPISIRSQKGRNETKHQIFLKIFVRSIKLVLLGLAMNTSSSPRPVSLENLRFPGVLQRFGVCYFVASIMFLFLAAEDESSHSNVQQPQRRSDSVFCKDFRILSTPWMIIALVVTAHCLITFLLPVPGCPTGYLGPGGLHVENKYSAKCIGGSAGYIDRVIFSEAHIYARPTAKRVYKTGSYDPEGILGILTSLFQVWLGVHTGIILLTFSQPWGRIKRILVWAIISGTVGGVLCGGIADTGWIPVNKNLWSLSYVLVTSSLAWFLLSFLYFVVDAKNIWSGGPFYQAGMNSICLYVGHDIAHSMIPWNYAFGPMNTHISHLIESLWGTSLWIIVSIYLYNCKLFWVI